MLTRKKTLDNLLLHIRTQEVWKSKRNELHSLQASHRDEHSFPEISQSLRMPSDALLLHESSKASFQDQVEQQNAQETSKCGGFGPALDK